MKSFFSSFAINIFAKASEVSVRKSFIMLVGAFNPFIHLHTMMMTSVFFTHPMCSSFNCSLMESLPRIKNI